jgi:GH25 family lysozyme M1 (1,4-beta-N-acetylmuramidase)
MATSRGLDVSAYQPTQDWAAHKKNGVAFAFAKASEGQHTHDTKFATHIKGIKAAGLVPGAYHFAWPNQSVAAEAANYISAVKAYAGKGFTHWLDLERRSDGANYLGRTAAQIKAYAAAWIAAVQKAFPGQRVGVYTSGSDLAAGHVPAGVTLWYPAYPGTSVDTYAEAEKHARPAPSGRTVTFWQFTSNPATGPNLDENICYMSAADLRTWAGGATKPPPTPAPKPTPKPVVDLSKVVQAARTDPHAGQGHKTYEAGVRLVEAALLELGYLTSAYAHDGSYGSTTVAAYAKWQRHLGYSGTGADGIPGKTSLAKLGSTTGLFTVTA